jgi:hypothetical protein
MPVPLIVQAEFLSITRVLIKNRKFSINYFYAVLAAIFETWIKPRCIKQSIIFNSTCQLKVKIEHRKISNENMHGRANAALCLLMREPSSRGDVSEISHRRAATSDAKVCLEKSGLGSRRVIQTSEIDKGLRKSG